MLEWLQPTHSAADLAAGGGSHGSASAVLPASSAQYGSAALTPPHRCRFEYFAGRKTGWRCYSDEVQAQLRTAYAAGGSPIRIVSEGHEYIVTTRHDGMQQQRVGANESIRAVRVQDTTSREDVHV